MIWDKVNFNGKVMVNDIIEIVCKYILEMWVKGVDVVVVVVYFGFFVDLYQVMVENLVYYLSQVFGVDVIMFGYVYVVFLGKDFVNIKGVDIVKGMLNGVLVVMLGMWGDYFGVVDLVLNNDSGKWQVIQSKVEVWLIYDVVVKKLLVVEDGKLVVVLKVDYDVICEFVSKLIGKFVDNMYSYLVLVQDDLMVQVVNMVQKVYVEYYIQGDLDLVKLLVFFVVVLFKVGGCKNDLVSFVEVEKGQFIFCNVVDFYFYFNILVVMKVSGKEVKEWLECFVGQFNQIDFVSSKLQLLINWDGFCIYNFDVIDGVNYQIDVIQLVCYDGECQMIYLQVECIKYLIFNGKLVDLQVIFLVVINNYCVYGGKFVGIGESYIVFVLLDENCLVLVVWIGV